MFKSITSDIFDVDVEADASLTWDLDSELACEERRLAALDAIPTERAARYAQRRSAARRRRFHTNPR